MARTVIYGLRALDSCVCLDEVEPLAVRVVAAYNHFGANVAKGDPKRAGGVLGEFPRPLHGAVLRAHAPTVQADGPQLLRRQPRRTRCVGDHVVHPP